MRNIRIFTDEELHGAVYFLTLPTLEYGEDGRAVLYMKTLMSLIDQSFARGYKEYRQRQKERRRRKR